MKILNSSSIFVSAKTKKGLIVMNKGFLKEIIYRIDYLYLPDDLFEKFYSLLFSEFQEKLNRFKQINIAPDNKNTSSLEKAYVLSNENEFTTLTISRSFIRLSAKLRQKSRIQYNNWVARIVKTIKDNELKFVFKKIEIRKNNKFFIESKHFKNIKDIFKTDFSYDDIQDMQIDYMDNKQIYKNNNAYFAIFTKATAGILSNKSLKLNDVNANLIQFDYAYYSDDEQICFNLIKSPVAFLKNVQQVIYDRFTKMINEDVLKYIDSASGIYDRYKIILID